MKFRYKYSQPTPYDLFPSKTLGEHLTAQVIKAPDYHDGQLESLERRVKELTEIISHIANSLPPLIQKSIGRKLDLIADKEID